MDGGTGGAGGIEIIATDAGRVTQAPSDVLRMAVAVVALLVVTVMGVLFGETMVAFVADLLRGCAAMNVHEITCSRLTAVTSNVVRRSDRG